MQSLFNHPQGVLPFQRVLWQRECRQIGYTERDTRLQRRGVPPGNESWKHGLVAARCDTEEIDDGYPVLERLAKPTIVGGVRVLAHKGVIDRFVGLEYLPMHLALVVVPHPGTRPRKDRPDRKQEPHLPWLEHPALRIHERNAFTLEDETGLQLSSGQVIVSLAEPSHMLECCQTLGCVTINISHAQRLSLPVQTHGLHQAPAPR